MIKNITPTLSEGGKIKIGGLGEVRKGGSGKYRLPQKHEYFTLTKTVRGPDVDGARGDLLVDDTLMDALMAEGEALTEIPIVLHSDEVEDVFPTSYAMYSGRKLACRGDGVTAMRHMFDEKKKRTEETKEIPCMCSYFGERCKPHATLHCSYPCARAGGRWLRLQMAHHLHHLHQEMLGSLTQIKATTYGVLQGLPLWLVLRPVEVSPQGKTSTVYCCHVELRAKDVADVQRQALELAKMRNTMTAELAGARAEYRAMLTAPEEDEEEVAAEFHPSPTNSAVVESETPVSEEAPLQDDVPSKDSDAGASSSRMDALKEKILKGEL